MVVKRDQVDPSVQADVLAACEQRIGYRFSDRRLLTAALTHASGAAHRLASNERLEFLGDSILGLVVCEELFSRYPESLEGELTRIKSVVVSRVTCSMVSDSLGLKEFLILGKGITVTGTVPPSLLADVFESLVAAIYLDGGYEPAKNFIVKNMNATIESVANREADSNYKSTLQQIAQRNHGTTPTYALVDEKGPDHSKCFRVAAKVGGQQYTAAWGNNKKEAEQRAACNALAEMNGDDIPFDQEE